MERLDDRGNEETLTRDKVNFDEKELDKFCELINEEVGLVLDKPKYRSKIAWKINKRINKLEMKDSQEYYEYIWFSENSNEELRQLVNACVVGETLFYRYADQTKFISNEVLPRLIRSRANSQLGSIRVLSAGCSKGAEPYSFAIAYLEVCEKYGYDPQEPGLEIIGVDISTSALQKAREGKFSPRTVENAPPHIVKKYFEKEGGKYILDKDVQELVTFRYFNLVNSTPPRELDLIYCRNVLIYFEDYVRDKVFQKLHRSLRKEGLFLLGPSEAISPPGELFEEYDSSNLQIYQKWSTDRRLPSIWDDDGEQKDKSILDRREPAYKKSPPEITSPRSDEQKQVIKISGVVGQNIPYAKFRQQLRKLITPEVKKYIVDLRPVKYIANSHLKELTDLLSELIQEDFQVKIELITRDQELRKNLKEKCEHGERFSYGTKIRVSDFGGSGTEEKVDDSASKRDVFEKTEKGIQTEEDEESSGSAIDDLLSETREESEPEDNIKVTERRSKYVLRLSGCLNSKEDPSLARRLKEEVSNLLSLVSGASSSRNKLLIKLTSVEYIDRKLVEIIKRGRRAAGDRCKFEVRCNSDKISRKLERWGI